MFWHVEAPVLRATGFDRHRRAAHGLVPHPDPKATCTMWVDCTRLLAARGPGPGRSCRRAVPSHPCSRCSAGCCWRLSAVMGGERDVRRGGSRDQHPRGRATRHRHRHRAGPRRRGCPRRRLPLDLASEIADWLRGARRDGPTRQHGGRPSRRRTPEPSASTRGPRDQPPESRHLGPFSATRTTLVERPELALLHS
jgi:hypothetical protein